MTCGYLFETLRTFHNVPGQGTSASAAATTTSGVRTVDKAVLEPSKKEEESGSTSFIEVENLHRLH